MAYVDFFCLPLKKGKEAEYKVIAEEFLATMKKLGLMSYCEAVADDVPRGKVTDFYRAVQATEEETVVASYCVWPNKETRDKAWEELMKDDSKKQLAMPFDGRRMFWGGFNPIIQYGEK